MKPFDIFYNFKARASSYASFPQAACFENTKILIQFKNTLGMKHELVLNCANGTYSFISDLSQDQRENISMSVLIDQDLESCLDDGLDYKNVKILDYKKTEGELNALLNNLDSVYYHALGGLNVESRLSIPATA
jgi:hypothetical protein